jgi:hypothetical protein
VGVRVTVLQSDTVHPYGRTKEDTSPLGVEIRTKGDRGYGEGVGVRVTVLQSDTVQSYGHTKEDTSSVGVELCTKPKDLIASEREDRGYGEIVRSMCVVVVSKTSCKDINQPILRGVITPHHFFFSKIMIFLHF